MNLSELAKLSNCSVSTVSKAFSDAPDVSSETKQHIFKIAKQYGCYGKYYKGKYKKPILALICPEIRSQYYAKQIEGLQKEIERTGGICLIATDSFCAEKQAEQIEYFSSYLGVDGILVFHLKKPVKKGIETPIVALSSGVDKHIDTIQVDNRLAIEQAILHLKSLGHRYIGFIGDPLTKRKQNLFIDALHHALLPVEEQRILTISERFENAGYSGVKQIVESGIPCTALFCAYDYLALGAIKYLEEAGKRIPADVSVIGMDNNDMSGYLSHALTTIGPYTDKVTKIAVNLMNKKLQNRYFCLKKQLIITGKLVLRDTTGPAPL